MKKLRVLLRQHFGFSKSESNGILFLTTVLVLIFSIEQIYFKFLFKPEKIKIDPLEIDFAITKIKENRKKTKISNNKSGTPKTSRSSNSQLVSLKKFNPNTANFQELQNAGFQSEIAYRIISYREKVNSFEIKSDLFSIYDIDHDLLKNIWEKIDLPEEKNKKFLESNEKSLTLDERSPVELNSADSMDLMKVNGIGPVLSNRIVKYRNLLGGFNSFQQLNEVYNLHDSIIQILKQNFIIDSSNVIKVNINTTSTYELSRHPYISRNTSKIITNYRDQHGEFIDIQQLKNIKVIDDSLYQKLYPYISVIKSDTTN